MTKRITDRERLDWLESRSHGSIDFCPQSRGGVWVWQGASLDGVSDDNGGRWFKRGLRQFCDAAIRAERRGRKK